MHITTVFNRWIVTRRYCSLQILSKNGEIKRKFLLEKMIETKENFEKMDVELDSSHGFEREFNIRSSNMNLMTYILIFSLVIHSHLHLRKLDHYN